MRPLTALLALAAASPVFAQGDKTLIPVVELKRTTPVSYDKDVEPILRNKCIVCHSGKELKGNLDLGSYEALVKGGKRGPSIVPGKGSDSLLYKLLRREMKPFMPPKGEEPVTPEEVALVKLWIDEGAKAPTTAREKVKVVVGVPPANVHPVRAIAVSADAKAPIVASGRGNQIHLYEAVSGDHKRSLVAPGLKTSAGKDVSAAHLSIVESLAFSPDGKTLVSGSFQEVNLWDPETGELKKKIPGFAHNVVALAFSADGKMLATAGGEPTVDGEVKVFDTATWNQIMELKAGHSDTAYGVCFSPDGKMIATGSADKFIKVWSVPSAKFVKSFEGHVHHVLDVGWSPDGKFLVSGGGDDTVRVWDFEKGEQARNLSKLHGKQVSRVLFAGKKGEVLTAGGDKLVKLVNPQNGNANKTFAGGTDFMYAMGANGDASIVATGGQDGVVRVYNSVTGALTKTLLPPDAQPKSAEKK